MLINSYAKINLYLDVLNKRPDGYHEIETVFCTISLHDSLKFALTKKPGIEILCDVPELASNSNLIHTTAKRIVDDFDVKTGIKVFIRKRIPMAAGLGGGSSNAAMTFFAMQKLLGLELQREYKEKTGAELGSDINFFFTGGMALGTGRGEIVFSLPEVEDLELLLVNPGIAISSREAYSLVNLESLGTRPRNKRWFNALEPGIRQKYAMVDRILNSLKEIGAEQAMMSGSGSTCIGYFPDRIMLSRAYSCFRKQHLWCTTVKTLDRSQYQKCIQN